ncbi:radical SAM protein [uncultured Sphaerochaeta sp.]|uniref:radical SAM protein n=1 Tax=uncultured Sphaerochaeta sp. TaxID=886478 RepID=UPI002A0A7D5E|nr:radical SAM protein [uncultured Sphaerochaeta sp.]
MSELQETMQAYTHCSLCPNYCGVDRTKGQYGRCGESDQVRIAWSGLHRGEEPPVTGTKGSGMIFFCGCPLHCAYCQNHQISKGVGRGESSVGISVSIHELANLMLALQAQGATNINLVTGTHFIPSIILAIQEARLGGLTLQMVWNSSGYESLEGLALIDPYVDLYLIDVKTLDSEVAAKYCGLGSYSSIIGPVMNFLVEKHPRVRFDKQGNMQGLLVRHLLFPGTLDATKTFLKYFAKKLKKHAWLSLMVQFVPPEGENLFEEITEEEYDSLIDLLEDLMIDNGFVQELADNIPWIPDFTKDVPFPESFAEVLPYFLELKHQKPD